MTTFKDMPNEIIDQIFNNISLQNQSCIASTCKQFNDQITYHKKCFKKKCMSHLDNISNNNEQLIILYDIIKHDVVCQHCLIRKMTIGYPLSQVPLVLRKFWYSLLIVHGQQCTEKVYEFVLIKHNYKIKYIAPPYSSDFDGDEMNIFIPPSLQGSFNEDGSNYYKHHLV
jgi:hypothetical protein